MKSSRVIYAIVKSGKTLNWNGLPFSFLNFQIRQQWLEDNQYARKVSYIRLQDHVKDHPGWRISPTNCTVSFFLNVTPHIECSVTDVSKIILFFTQVWHMKASELIFEVNLQVYYLNSAFRDLFAFNATITSNHWSLKRIPVDLTHVMSVPGLSR